MISAQFYKGDSEVRPTRQPRALGLSTWRPTTGRSDLSVVEPDKLHQDDDPFRNLDKTLREEESDTIDGDADAAADPDQVVT